MSPHPYATAELELRLLPGVSYVSIRQRETTTAVELFVDTDDVDQTREAARRIVDAYIPPPATISCLSPGRSRVRLVDIRPAGNAIEVELAHRERTVASTSGGLSKEEVATATIEALERLGLPVPFRVSATQTVTAEGEYATVVVLRDGSAARYGVADGTHERAVVRATLSALNRHLSSVLAG